MKRLAVMLAIAIGSFATFRLTFPSYPYRSRLQISLSVGEKVYTGSSVIQVNWSCGPKITGLGQCAASLGGQATLIDLGSNGVIVATLHTGDTVYPVPDGAVDAMWLCANAFGHNSTYEDLPTLPFLKGRRELSPTNFPRLVWFSNPADPKSAQKLTVATIANLVDPTARFTEAFVEITGVPLLVDIPRRLPWYPAMLEAQAGGKGILGKTGEFQLVYNMFVGEDST